MNEVNGATTRAGTDKPDAGEVVRRELAGRRNAMPVGHDTNGWHHNLAGKGQGCW